MSRSEIRVSVGSYCIIIVVPLLVALLLSECTRDRKEKITNNANKHAKDECKTDGIGCIVSVPVKAVKSFELKQELETNEREQNKWARFVTPE